MHVYMVCGCMWVCVCGCGVGGFTYLFLVGIIDVDIVWVRGGELVGGHK